MFSPFFDQDLGFTKGIEDLSIEQFVPEPNYESPQDADTNNTYAFTVTASYTDDQGTPESAQSAATATVRYGDFKHAGSAGDDEMRGRYGDDILIGGDGKDSIIGGWGHDTLKGNTGSDSLRGWRGEDVLFGGTEDDFLYGGKGNDTLNGGGGEDLLFGRTGDDDLSGGRGQDTLKGRRGDDLLTGGFGADTFLFGRDNGNATITDFNLGKDVTEIDQGARSLRQIDFAQAGDDVVLTFGATTVRVENTTLAELNNADHFLFT